MVGKRVTLLSLLLIAFAIAPAHAAADTTHPYLGQIELQGGNNPLPAGVDSAGNVIVFLPDEGVVKKFSPSGVPVDFSALGSNTIDGKGGFDCPNTPEDCDRVPSLQNGFGVPSFSFNRHSMAAVDQSDGPASGFIYVADFQETSFAQGDSAVFAFDQTGRYRGQIDETQAFPRQGFPEEIRGINVSPGGSVFVVRQPATTGVVDKYVPLDDDPANHLFAGQLRSGFGPELDAGSITFAIGDDQYIYNRKSNSDNPFSMWRKFEPSELFRPIGNSQPIDHSPAKCKCGAETGPFGDGGREIEFGIGSAFEWGSIDPATHDVYLINPWTGHMEQWNQQNEKIGPTFGTPEQLPNFEAKTVAFDNSGGATDGRFYVKRFGNQLAVFGPPVTIPDITNVEADPSHASAEVTATIGTDEGPEVTSCTVQWSSDYSYTSSTPCQPPAPYSEETDVTASLSGLATEVDYNYRVIASNADGTNTTESFKLHTVAVEKLVTEAASDITPTTATLNGSLDTEGEATEYKFEYGIDTNYLGSTPWADTGDLNGGGNVPPVTIDQLQPGRTYHFRLVASNSIGTTYGQDRTFVAATSPTISGVVADEVDADSAVLNARINPQGFETTYTFEYGPTTDYGSEAPIPAGSAGSGTEPVQVEVPIGDLEGVTYHFRVVATNQWGTTESPDTTFDFFPPGCPNAVQRQRTGSNFLPDCRAYELVTPGNAGAVQMLPGDVLVDFPYQNNAQLAYWKIPGLNEGQASSPARFAFLGGVGAVTGTEPPNSLIDRYVSTRTNEGWITRYPGTKGSEAVFAAGHDCSLSMDFCFDYALNDFFVANDAELGESSPTLYEAGGRRLGRLPTNVTLVPNGRNFIGDDRPAPDFSHYTFSSRNVSFAPGGLTQAPGSAYNNDLEESTVQIISILPGGGNIGQDGGTPTEFLRIPAVSDDGSHVLMSNVEFEGRVNLFLRVDNAVSYEVSKGAGVNLIGMTANGEKVVFSTREQLLPSDTDNSTDIYVWNEGDGTDFLEIATQGNGKGDTDACNSNWTGQCDVQALTPERIDLDDMLASQSGDVYFYSPEQLDPTNPGVPNERNLYVFRDGSVQYVSTLDAGTQIDRIQISPDGDHAGFLTVSEMTGYDSAGWRQMYTYDAEDRVVRCASCLPSGEPPQIMRKGLEVAFETEPPPEAHVLASQSGRFMSDDGRVAFTTSDALVPGDTNNILDVYEFVDGRPHLITSGTGERDRFPGGLLIYPTHYVGLEAVSADGVDIYFSTYETLVDEDANGSFLKFYDARTNGGFIPPPPELPCTAADECHGPESSPPAALEVGTGTHLGDGGNERAERKAKRAAKRKAARKARRARKAKKKRRAAQRRLGRQGR